MKKKNPGDPAKVHDSTKEFELALEKKDDSSYVFRLFVSGMTPNSRRAIENVKKLCEEHLKGRYQLQVIDIYQQPHLARAGQVVAAPTLLKELPLPLRRFIGDMSNADRILLGLGLRSRGTAAGK